MTRIRPATLSDHRTLAEIATHACIDDSLDAFLYTRRRTHPDAYRQLYFESVRGSGLLLDHGFLVIVAEVDAAKADDETAELKAATKQIAGYAVWCREGKNKKEIKRECREIWTQSGSPTEDIGWKEKLFHRLTNIDAVDTVRTMLNPASSASHLRALSKASTKEEWLDPDYIEPKECWYLCELAVSPIYQRRGVGSRLVKWGMDRAKIDGVPATLHSSPAGQQLYLKLGFVVKGWWKWGTCEQQEFPNMRWDPPG